MIDVLVIGGGPAGLATAIYAAQADLEVAIVEPRTAPTDKACGEGLMPCAVRMLRTEMGVGVEGRPFYGICYQDARGLAEARFREGNGLGVRRTSLSAAMHERLQELSIPLVRARLEAVSQDRSGVRVTTAAVHDQARATELEARWLVAADGLHSPLRRRLGLEARRRAHPARFGLRRHFALAPWSDVVEVHWATHSEAYVTPIDDNVVGVAVLTSVRGPFEEQVREFPALMERLSGGQAMTAVRGAGPLRQQARTCVHGRVLLVGDAAGYVDALTGEGLSIAFATAGAAVRCLRAGRPAHYRAGWRRRTRSYRLLTGGLLWARRRPLLASRIVPAAARLPRLFDSAVDLLAR